MSKLINSVQILFSHQIQHLVQLQNYKAFFFFPPSSLFTDIVTSEFYIRTIYCFFQEKCKTGSETAGYPLASGTGVTVHRILSHPHMTLATGRHISAEADRASTVSSTKHPNCQPVWSSCWQVLGQHLSRWPLLRKRREVVSQGERKEKLIVSSQR